MTIATSLPSSEAAFAIVVEAALKGTPVLLLAMLLAVVLRKRSAALRHVVWATALCSLCVLPLLGVLGTGWEWTLPVDWVKTTPVTERPAPAISLHGVAELPVRPGDPGAKTLLLLIANHGQAAFDPTVEARTGGVEVEPTSAWPVRPATLWLAGVALALAPLGFGMLRLWQLRRAATPIASGAIGELFYDLTARLGLTQPFDLLQSDRGCMPMTWGVRRPVVLLPAEAATWTSDRLSVVLLHELTHVKRRDCLTQFVAHAVRAVFWFHPLVWWAVYRLKAEQERACDDAVLNAGSNAEDYAQHLLSVVARLPRGYFVTPVALAMSSARRLERRLLAILDPTCDRRSLSRRWILTSLVAAAAVLLPLASVRVELQARPLAVVGYEADGGPAPDESGPPKSLSEVRERVHKEYAGKVDEKVLTAGAIKGMLDALQDPYSAYLEPGQLQELQRQNAGAMTGIGVHIQLKDQQIVVVTPLEGSPALEAGLRAGDIIDAVDGQPVKGMELPAVVRKIMGASGSVVKVKVRHADGAEAEPAITRRAIRLSTLHGFRRDAEDRWDFLLDPTRKIGYVRITQFSTTTATELREAIDRLKKKDVKGLILDLRLCPGGLLSTAVQIANCFIADGPIVTIKGNTAETTHKAEVKNHQGDFPLIVLIDGRTASAAEIVAGALKDRQRAILIGDRTYGKGSVQTIIDLPANEGALKLTTAHYFLPSGRNIQKGPDKKEWGVDPTDGYYLPLTAKQTEALQQSQREREKVGLPKPKDLVELTATTIERDYADSQLSAALKSMQAKIEKGEFLKVGQPLSALEAQLAQRERLEKMRENLKKSLDEVNKELAELEKGATQEKK